MCRAHPCRDGVPCLLSDLELHRPPGLLLHDDCTGSDVTALDDIVHAETDQITATQLAINGEVEQREFARSMIQPQPNPDGPDFLQLKRGLLAKQLTFVPLCCTPFGCRSGIHERLLC